MKKESTGYPAKQKALYISIAVNLILASAVLLLVLKFNVIQLVVNKFNSDNAEQTGTNTVYDYKTSIFEVLPNDSNEIIFVGDSITDYVEWAEFFPDKNVKNRGISSDTTAGILQRIDEIVESNPEKLFFMIGINDIGDGIDNNIIAENYKKIINIVKEKSPNTKIYVQSVLPCNIELLEKNSRNIKRTEENILNLNNKIKKMCENENIVYIELNKYFKDMSNQLYANYTFDGLHINGDGYLLWVDLIKKYVYE